MNESEFEASIESKQMIFWWNEDIKTLIKTLLYLYKFILSIKKLNTTKFLNL